MIDIGFDGVTFGMLPMGGINTYAWEMLKRLTITPDVSATLGLPKPVISSKLSQIESLVLPTKKDKLPFKIARYMRSPLRNNLVHSTYYRTPHSDNTKSVITVYDFVHEYYRKGIPRTVHSIQKTLACRRADAILCISENTKRDLLMIDQQIDPSIVHVTPLALAHETFFVPDHSYPDISDAVVYIGHRVPYKRFDLAVESIALAGLRMAIVGADVQPKEKALLDSYLPGRWIALGRINDATLREVYAGAYAFIFTSDYEGFGLPILEAQACGCPAVVANRSSFPEVGGRAAVYAQEQSAEAYAACLNLLSDSNTRKEVISAGLANSAKFNWDHTFAMTLSVYRDLLA